MAVRAEVGIEQASAGAVQGSSVHSPEHRANLLDRRFADVGMARSRARRSPSSRASAAART